MLGAGAQYLIDLKKVKKLLKKRIKAFDYTMRREEQHEL